MVTELTPAARAQVLELPPRERWRLFKDRCFAVAMAVGGVSVLVAILLIFFYLFWVVLPLFKGASAQPGPSWSTGLAEIRHFAWDEYAEIGLAVEAGGRYRFLRGSDGALIAEGDLARGSSAAGTAVGASDPVSRTLFTGTGDGSVTVARVEYDISYPNDRRHVEPRITFPLGDTPIVLSKQGEPLRLIAGQAGEDEFAVAGVTNDGALHFVKITRETSFLDDEVTLDAAHVEISVGSSYISHLLMDVDQSELYVITADGLISYYDIRNADNVRLVDRAEGVVAGRRITAAAFLSGGISLIIGDDAGGLAQWFPVRDDANNESLERVREFGPLNAAVRQIAPEHYRKAFAAVDERGGFALYHATSNRELVADASGFEDTVAVAMSPRANALSFVSQDGQISTLVIDNDHPEVSMSSLWGKVWYESRAGPEYIWQSSSASSDFEPKFSLTPLTFGTFKAAFYAMLFAMPLAILGAIYTAYFMTPRMRGIVKPSIEVMAALPTVILGFLAGLWLAPLVEAELAGILLCFPLVPLFIVAASYAFSRAPASLRKLLPDGWEALGLVPVICLAVALSLLLGRMLDTLLFGGSLANWMSTEYGISYDQRNSLVVGMAIGFAVIPTIFSISEDAVFGVPRHLTMGSLALGATPWQTMTKIVLLTASPGIFSSVMIGMGRAVGETMIVLMATGNTPIMDFNIFEGFRALSANIAVEMPESEVNSTHYRILFLAALVLFLATFVFNTLAEIVRQRLRVKYSSL